MSQYYIQNVIKTVEEINNPAGSSVVDISNNLIKRFSNILNIQVRNALKAALRQKKLIQKGNRYYVKAKPVLKRVRFSGVHEVSSNIKIPIKRNCCEMKNRPILRKKYYKRRGSKFSKKQTGHANGLAGVNSHGPLSKKSKYLNTTANKDSSSCNTHGQTNHEKTCCCHDITSPINNFVKSSDERIHDNNILKRKVVSQVINNKECSCNSNTQMDRIMNFCYNEFVLPLTSPFFKP